MLHAGIELMRSCSGSVLSGVPTHDSIHAVSTPLEFARSQVASLLLHA
jgi:hypothetical protein